MKNYLVVGLESTCTRIVSRLIALNLGIISDIDEWDGYDQVYSKYYSVTHRSLPHGSRLKKRFFISFDEINNFDKVIITSRDINCLTKSKLISHQPDLSLAIEENNRAIEILKEVINERNVYIFSYESAQLFQDAYVNQFLKSIDIDDAIAIQFENINEKYFIKEENE